MAGMTFEEPVTTAESYALAGEYVADVVSEQLGKAAESISATWDGVFEDVDTLLNDAANVQQAAADTMSVATDRFADYVEFLVNNGVRVRLDAGGEVNV